MNYRPTHFPITREAWPFAIPVALVGVLAAWLHWPPVALFLGLLLVYILFFFRNPERQTPADPLAVTAPADGKVVAAGIVSHPEFEGGQALRIAVFMSLFNVHMNWAPCAGKVEKTLYCPGSFLNAMEDKCSEENERKVLTLRTPHGVLLVVKLVAGLVARRIVCPVEQGDCLSAGDKIGLIRFGSRVETLLPATSILQVKVGMHVRGGETVLALLEQHSTAKCATDQKSQKP